MPYFNPLEGSAGENEGGVPRGADSVYLEQADVKVISPLASGRSANFKILDVVGSARLREDSRAVVAHVLLIAGHGQQPPAEVVESLTAASGGDIAEARLARLHSEATGTDIGSAGLVEGSCARAADVLLADEASALVRAARAGQKAAAEVIGALTIAGFRAGTGCPAQHDGANSLL